MQPATDRLRSVVVAGHQGDLDTIEDSLSDVDPDVRGAALAALARCGALTATRLQAGFADDSPLVRRRAAELSANRIDVSPTPLLSDTDPGVVETACFAAGEIAWADTAENSAPLEALAAIATGHDDALCREAAVAALGAIGDPTSIDAVLGALADRVTVRRRAVLALAAFEDPRVEEALESALADKDWQVRQAAEDLLQVGRRLDGELDPDAYADD